MSKLVNKWIDLFRAGDYTAAGKGVFTEDDVQKIVDNYDPSNHEAPGVIGHTEGETPAYCWFSALRRVGGLLQGQIGSILPAFEDALLEKKLYKKRSVELYPGGANGHSLRRVAFLGSNPPQVKGLADIKFEQEDREAIAIEFAEESDVADLKETDRQSIIDGVIAKFRELFPSHKPAEPTGAATFSEADVKRFAAEAVAAAVGPLKTELDAATAKFGERDAALATAETKQRAAAAKATLVAKGAWIPAFDVAGVPAVFDELAKATTTIDFGEGDKKVSRSPLDVLVSFMEGLGQIVPIGRKVEGAAGAGTKTANFNESPQVKADANSLLFHEEILKRMKSDSKLSYGTAMNMVAEEHPELTRPGTSTAGTA